MTLHQRLHERKAACRVMDGVWKTVGRWSVQFARSPLAFLALGPTVAHGLQGNAHYWFAHESKDTIETCDKASISRRWGGIAKRNNLLLERPRGPCIRLYTGRTPSTQ